MKKFLAFVITPLLSKPEELNIVESASVVSVKVAKDDMGRIIGKQGATISAIRTMVRTYCALHSLSPVSLNLEEG